MSTYTELTVEGLNAAITKTNTAITARRTTMANYLTTVESVIVSHKELANYTAAIAHLEGVRHVRVMALSCLEALTDPERHEPLTKEALASRFTMMLLKVGSHVDDSWSGRGNDVARSYEDGVREEVRNLADRLAYGGPNVIG